MSEEVDLYAAAGWIEPRLKAEFPRLALEWVTVETRLGASPRALRARLRELSSGYRGSTVVAIRQRPVGHAYRVFYREIGLDPDVARIPLEQAALDRLRHGQFVSRGLLEDAMLIALVETGVGVWALDAQVVDAGGLGIRISVEGDRLGKTEHGNHPGSPSHLRAGRLVVADAESVHAILFGEVAPGHAPSADTERVALFTVRIDGVPQIHIEEALWICVEALNAG
jgi:DNA/RNA-binding domain of Phe-tRNA-synthetase-like protein